MKSFRSFVLAPLADQLTLLGKQIMTSIADVQNELTTVTSKLADALTRITAHEQAEDATNAALQGQVATLSAANADLQSQIDALKAAGTDTTALDAIMATLKGVESSIDGIDVGPAAPPAAPSGESPVP
jgi:predicted  nucleic acid-binding Zn-ribbon protein